MGATKEVASFLLAVIPDNGTMLIISSYLHPVFECQCHKPNDDDVSKPGKSACIFIRCTFCPHNKNESCQHCSQIVCHCGSMCSVCAAARMTELEPCTNCPNNTCRICREKECMKCHMHKCFTFCCNDNSCSVVSLCEDCAIRCLTCSRAYCAPCFDLRFTGQKSKNGYCQEYARVDCCWTKKRHKNFALFALGESQ